MQHFKVLIFKHQIRDTKFAQTIFSMWSA